METLLRLAYRAINYGRTYQQTKQHRKELRHTEEKARVLEQRPSPLPATRRNLSHTSLSTHPQTECLLFTILPAEIRQRIYCFVLGGDNFHLTHVSKRIVHRRLDITEHQLNDEETPTGIIPLPLPPQFEWEDERSRNPKTGQSSAISMLSLLQTCHAIYAEATPILYNSNVFSMSSPIVLLYLKDYVLRPEHQAEIRHLQLVAWFYFNNPVHFTGRVYEPFDEETWPRFWEIVSEMNLKSLGLWCEYSGREDDCSIDSKWIQPLLKVTGVEKVGAQLQFRSSVTGTRRLHALEDEAQKKWTERRVI